MTPDVPATTPDEMQALETARLRLDPLLVTDAVSMFAVPREPSSPTCPAPRVRGAGSRPRRPRRIGHLHADHGTHRSIATAEAAHAASIRGQDRLAFHVATDAEIGVHARTAGERMVVRYIFPSSRRCRAPMPLHDWLNPCVEPVAGRALHRLPSASPPPGRDGRSLP